MKRRVFVKLTGILAAGFVFPNKIYAMIHHPGEIKLTMRIHHFFDIIRDLRTGEKLEADILYKHSYHIVANSLRDSPETKMKIVIDLDSVCEGCIHNKDGKCDDPLTIKKGFAMKNDYNNYLDKRILEKIGISEGDIVTPREICKSADNYIENMNQIYTLDSKEEISQRKMEFIEGLKFYSNHNDFTLRYLSKYS